MDESPESSADAGGVDVAADPRRPSSYPYLSAVEDRRRRMRAGLVWLAIAVGLAAVVGVVLLMTSGHRGNTPATADAGAATATAEPSAPNSAATTTSRPPFGGKYVAPVVTTPAAAATAPPPLPTATLTAAPTEVVCNEGAAETATVLSWTSTGAVEAVLVGPDGQLSTLTDGNREVVPSRACSEAPFEDGYAITVGNATGAASAEARVRWVANTEVAGSESD